MKEPDVLKEFTAVLRRARQQVFGGRGAPRVRTVRQAVRDRPAWALGTAARSRLTVRQRRQLEAIAAAEARLDAGTFGLCEKCRRPISLRRLRTTPTVRRCARCARGASRSEPTPNRR